MTTKRMTGPGVYVTNPICFDCLQIVVVKVRVFGDGSTDIISGIEEHRRECRRG